MTPDTDSYLLLGLVVVLGILALYVSSLVLRLKNARDAAARVQQFLEE